jgi:hypothetical protein
MDVETYIGVVSEGQIRLLEPKTLPEGSRVYIVVPSGINDVLDTRLARRKANRWLLENVGNLVMADHPQFIQAGKRVMWRFEAFLTAKGHPPVGPIGEVMVDARTGAVLNNKESVEEMIIRGESLASTAFSSTT